MINNETKKIALAPFIMCILAAIFYCYEYYLRVAPSVMREDLMQAYNLSSAGLGTLVAYYYVAYTPLQIPAGIIMDRWGPRKILTLACLLCAFGSYMFSGNNALNIAKIGRFIVGFGSAFAYVGVLKIANLWLPRRYFAMMAGLCTALGMLGAMGSEIFMAGMVEYFGWQKTLYFAAFLGLLLSMVLWLFIKDQSDFRITHRETNLWQDLLEIIKMRQLWISGFIGCCTFLPLSVFAEMWAVSFLETVGLNKHNAALGSSMVFLGFAVGGPLWGLLSDFIKSRRLPLFIGSSLSTIVALVLIIWPPDAIVLLYILLFSVGLFASAEIIVFAVGNDICRPNLAATTIAFINMLVMLGGMLLQPLVGVILDLMPVLIGDNGLVVYNLADFKMALLVMPIGLAIAAVLALCLKESYRS